MLRMLAQVMKQQGVKGVARERVEKGECYSNYSRGDPQPARQRLALLGAQRPDKNRRSHTPQHTTFRLIFGEIALTINIEVVA